MTAIYHFVVVDFYVRILKIGLCIILLHLTSRTRCTAIFTRVFGSRDDFHPLATPTNSHNKAYAVRKKFGFSPRRALVCLWTDNVGGKTFPNPQSPVRYIVACTFGSVISKSPRTRVATESYVRTRMGEARREGTVSARGFARTSGDGARGHTTTNQTRARAYLLAAYPLHHYANIFNIVFICKVTK